MHIICLMECHPDHKKKIIDDVSNLSYKVTDNNGHQIENKIQVRELSLIDLVVQEKAADDVLNQISPYIENGEGGSEKLKNKTDKISKYLCMFGGLNKIKLPKLNSTRAIFKERNWKPGKILPLGSMIDVKNEQGLDRL